MSELELLKMALVQTEGRLATVLGELNKFQNTERLVEELQKRATHKLNMWDLEVCRKPDFNFYSSDPTKRAKVKKYRVHIYEVEE